MKYFLGFVFLLFMGVLGFVYWGAKQANPVMLDEKGRPYTAETHR